MPSRAGAPGAASESTRAVDAPLRTGTRAAGRPEPEPVDPRHRRRRRGYVGRCLRELQQHFRSASEPQESIAQFDLNYDLLDGAVFTELGASAAPGDLYITTSSDCASERLHRRHSRAPAQRSAL